MTKFSLFVHDLSLTPIGRAYPIARSLETLGHSVEVLGFLIDDDEIYYPYRDLLEYKVIDSKRYVPHILHNAAKLAGVASGEIIYAFKPLWTSYWPALLASSFGKERLLLLDVEDEELLFPYQGTKELISRRLIRGWPSPLSWQYRVLLHPLTSLAHEKTVASNFLKNRYGGEILLHGPDAELFDPMRFNSKHCRERWNLPLDVPLAGFIGNPHPHKGLHVLVNALTFQETRNIHLVLAGNTAHPQFQFAKKILKDRCHLLSYVPNSQLPEVLSALDVVPIPQLDSVYSRAQIPAKLLEAMAMAKPIVTTTVSDLPQILGIGTSYPRGWVVKPGTVCELAVTLGEIICNREEGVRRGSLAREYYLREASPSALSEKLATILAKQPST